MKNIFKVLYTFLFAFIILMGCSKNADTAMEENYDTDIIEIDTNPDISEVSETNVVSEYTIPTNLVPDVAEVVLDEETKKIHDIVDRKLERFNNRIVNADLYPAEQVFYNGPCHDISYNGKYFITGISMRSGTQIMTSTDASHWTEIGYELPSDFPTNILHFATAFEPIGDKWVVGTWDQGMLILDSDLKTFRTTSITNFCTERLITFNNSIYAIGIRKVSDDYSLCEYSVINSDNGFDWFEVFRSPTMICNIKTDGRNLIITTCAEGNPVTGDAMSKIYVMSKENKCYWNETGTYLQGGGFAIGSDGIEWRYIGNQGKIYVSKDLVNWTTNGNVVDSRNSYYRDLNFANGVWTAVVSYPNVDSTFDDPHSFFYYSIDGEKWEEIKAMGCTSGYYFTKCYNGIWSCGVTEGHGSSIYNSNLKTIFDPSIVNSKAEREELLRHTQETSIHVTPQDKVRWDSKSSFSGRYNDLIGAPRKIESVSQLINDSGFIDEPKVRNIIFHENIDHPTYTNAEVDEMFKNLEKRLEKQLEYSRFPANDNYNLKFYLIMEKGHIKWLPMNEVEEARDLANEERGSLH